MEERDLTSWEVTTQWGKQMSLYNGGEECPFNLFIWAALVL